MRDRAKSHVILYPSVPARPVSFLLICYSYPPVLGGSEIEAQRVSSALQERGHQVRILCAGGAPMPPVTDWVDPCGLRVRLFGGRWPKRWRGYIFGLGVAWTLLKDRRDYQIAYFLMVGSHLATGLPVAGLLRKRIVMKFSGSSLIEEMAKSWIGRLELRFLRRWATRILILNPGMAQEAKEAGLDPARIAWMPNPVDTGAFRPCSPEERAQRRRELNLSPDTPVVVFVGRLSTEKELAGLVGAFARVVRERPLATLALIGDGPLRDEITELTRNLGLERNVLLTGRLDTGGVIQWLQASDVFTLVSAVEGLPCSLLEAMSAGIAPLVSDIPAHTQLVDRDVHGLVVERGNQEEIAGGLVRLLDDSELRARLGAAARLRVLDQYSTSKVVSCYEALFASLLGS